MKLNAKEQAWVEKRKNGLKTKSKQPQYLDYGAAPKESFEDRMKKVIPVDPYSKEGQELQEANAKKHGRGWYIFQGMNFRYNRDSKTWIEQYYIESDRVKNQKRNKCLM